MQLQHVVTQELVVSNLHDQAVEIAQLTIVSQEPVGEGDKVQPQFELATNIHELMSEERGTLHHPEVTIATQEPIFPDLNQVAEITQLVIPTVPNEGK